MNTPHSKIFHLPLKISSQTQPALAHRVPRQRAECLAPFLVPSEEPNHRVKHRSKGPFPLAPLHTVTASLGPRMVTFQFDFYPAKQFWLNRFSKPTVVVVRKRQPSPRPSGAQVVTVIWLADSDAVHAHSPCHCQSHTNTVYNKHNSFWQHWTIFIISSVLTDIFLDDWWLKKKNRNRAHAPLACRVPFNGWKVSFHPLKRERPSNAAEWGRQAVDLERRPYESEWVLRSEWMSDDSQLCILLSIVSTMLQCIWKCKQQFRSREKVCVQHSEKKKCIRCPKTMKHFVTSTYCNVGVGILDYIYKPNSSEADTFFVNHVQPIFNWLQYNEKILVSKAPRH